MPETLLRNFAEGEFQKFPPGGKLQMTRWDFLDAVTDWTKALFKDVLLPKNADPEEIETVDPQALVSDEAVNTPSAVADALFKEDGSVMTHLKVYRMRLPDYDSLTAPAPYCLHQIVTGVDGYDETGRDQSSVLLRSVFCIYHPFTDDLTIGYDRGAERAMEVAERFRVAVLSEGMIADRFVLNLRLGQLETLYYPDDMRPYYITEVASNWDIPAVRREFRQHLGV